MRRQKPLAQPLLLQSPEDDLKDISLLQDAGELDHPDFLSLRHRRSKQNLLDGWVKLPPPPHLPPEDLLSTARSAVLQTWHRESHPNIRLLSGRTQHVRRFSYHDSHTQSRCLGTSEGMRRAQSHELSLDCRKIRANSPMGLELTQSGHQMGQQFNIRRTLGSRNGGKTPTERKMVEAVNYPILQICGDNPEKKIIPTIGRVRHMLQLKAKRK